MPISVVILKFISACDEGSYGGDCNETCGHCLDVKQCSKINGTCLTGCDTDYKGDMCKAREWIYWYIIF